MRTNTYEHLEGLARAKGVNCERRGKTIELTTPGGGTTACCDTVAEALDTMRNDETFSKLPIKLALRQHPFADLIKRSDKRIANAKEALSDSERGKSAMRDLKTFFGGAVSGLDSIGQASLLVLVEEFVKNSRRGFLD